MNALPILPADIAFVIAEQTRDPSTLAALCLVSSDVITVAGPRLVRSVAFGNHAQVVRYFSPSELDVLCPTIRKSLARPDMVRVGFKASFDASQMLFHTPDGLLPLVDERCYNYLKPVVGPNVLRVLPWPTPGPGLPVAALVVPVMSQVGTSVLDKWVNPFEFVVGDWHRTPTALNAIRGLDDKTGLSRTDRWTNLADVVVLGNYLRHPWSNNHSEWKIHLTTRITMDLSALDEAGTGSRTLMERFAARFETARSWAIDRSRISSRYVVERAMSEIEIEVVDDARQRLPAWLLS